MSARKPRVSVPTALLVLLASSLGGCAQVLGAGFDDTVDLAYDYVLPMEIRSDLAVAGKVRIPSGAWVCDGATLTIWPGTTIDIEGSTTTSESDLPSGLATSYEGQTGYRSDERPGLFECRGGGRIVAQGTQDEPIVIRASPYVLCGPTYDPTSTATECVSDTTTTIHLEIHNRPTLLALGPRDPASPNVLSHVEITNAGGSGVRIDGPVLANHLTLSYSKSSYALEVVAEKWCEEYQGDELTACKARKSQAGFVAGSSHLTIQWARSYAIKVRCTSAATALPQPLVIEGNDTIQKSDDDC